MARNYSRYTTFSPGDLEKQLKELALKTCAVTDAPDGWGAKRRHHLHLKWHECTVTYPDGTSGTCRYTRHGPKVHTFGYHWGEAGWILEDNASMRAGLDKMGFIEYRRYRLYDRKL